MITDEQVIVAARAYDQRMTEHFQREHGFADHEIYSHWRALTEYPDDLADGEKERWIETSQQQWDELCDAIRAGLEAFVSIRETI